MPTQHENASLADHLAAGAAALQAADLPGALEAYQDAVACAPLEPEGYRGLAAVFQAQARPSEALACRMAARALQGGNALELYNIGTAYLMTGHPIEAEPWLRLALRVDPELVVAHRNLAVVLRGAGRHAEAQQHAETVYRQQHCFDNGLDAPAVLLICAAGCGNVPLDFWFAPQAVRRIEYMIEYASPADDAATLATLPSNLVIFNAIGDADIARPILDRLGAFVASAGRIVLNLPEAVACTARDRLPENLAGIADLVVPPVVRVARAQVIPELRRRFDAEPEASCIVRPSGSHGGEGLVLVAAAAEIERLELAAADAFYLTRFHDFRSEDGYFRKYRMIFIDGRPYPYHLAISPHWLVHYFSADMPTHSWKLAEEARFLADPAAVLGCRAMTALAAIGARLGLDYAGVDFSIQRDGQMLLFEANATMLVHPEPEDSVLAYKNPYVEALRQAFAAMVNRRGSAAVVMHQCREHPPSSRDKRNISEAT